MPPQPPKSILKRAQPANYDDSEEEFSDSPEPRSSGNRQDDDSEIASDDEVSEGSEASFEDEEMEDYVDNEDEEEEDSNHKALLSTLSFGALTKAQTSLASKKKTSKTDTKTSRKSSTPPLTSPPNKKSTASPPPKRTSKSAPQELSSKKPVSRFRPVTDLPTSKPRDPRFDLAIGPVNESQFRKNYSFLKEYKESEIAALKEDIEHVKRLEKRGMKGVKEKKEEAERRLRSMESRKQVEEEKERKAALLAEHKKQERELVKKGKTPYFLKRSEQKKLLLMDKYSKLGEKELDRVIEKKRKRKAAKEKKNMPWARRTEA